MFSKNKKHWLQVQNMSKDILYLLNYFQTYQNVILIYKKDEHTNTT
jgi:hypothetical protein